MMRKTALKTLRSLMALALLAGSLTTALAADIFVPSGVADIATALGGATTGDVIRIDTAGTYDLPNVGVGVTIQGDVPGVTLDGPGGDIRLLAADITFRNVEIINPGAGQGLTLRVAGNATFDSVTTDFETRGIRGTTTGGIINVSNSTIQAGAIALDANTNGVTFNVSDSTITSTGNTPFNCNENDITMTVVNTVFDRLGGANASASLGGANWSASFTNCTFTGGIQGVGITNLQGSLVFDGCTFSSNNSNGVLIDNLASGLLEADFIDCVIIDNNNNGFRARTAQSDATITLTGCEITSNTNSGIYVDNTLLASNPADAAGTGRADVTIDSCVIEGQDDPANSGILLWHTSNAVVLNTLVDTFSQLVNVDEIDGAVTLYHNTLVSDNDLANTATTGIQISDQLTTPSTIDIQNNAIVGVGTGISISDANDSADLASVTIDYNLIDLKGIAEGNGPLDSLATSIAGANNITDAAVEFRSYSATVGAGDYIPGEFSPLINAGADLTATVAVDIEGRTRPLPAATAPDIGAFEEGSLVPVELDSFEVQ